MGESFTIQISSNLARQLVEDPEKSKKKTKKLKPKISREPQKVHPKQIYDDSIAQKVLQPPIYLPVPASQPAKSELDAIRSVLQESEKVVERLNKQQENMMQEVSQRAKELHDKEFKLPEQKPMPCLDEKNACLKCYKEHVKDPLKCSRFVQDFADCARKVRQQVSQADK